jgi:hypothetical protein
MEFVASFSFTPQKLGALKTGELQRGDLQNFLRHERDSVSTTLLSRTLLP